MQNDITTAISFVKGVVELLHPLVEGVVHDLESGTIKAIFNNFSQRSIGEPSPLKELNIPTDHFPDIFPPYYKTNFDGRKLKCISMTIRNKTNQAIGLICLNYDISIFEQVRHLSSKIFCIDDASKNPIELFSENWQEQIKDLIENHLQEHKLSFKNLTRKEKREIILHLNSKGIFNYKNATVFTSDYLNISRASLYNYLKGK